MNNKEIKQATQALNNAKADVRGFNKGSKFFGAIQGLELHKYEMDSLEADIYLAIFMAHLKDRFPNGVKADKETLIIQ